jgi:hypothetical protein
MLKLVSKISFAKLGMQIEEVGAGAINNLVVG